MWRRGRIYVEPRYVNCQLLVHRVIATFKLVVQGSAKTMPVLIQRRNLYSWYTTLGRPNFWRILQSPFFGFLGICMCGPEEDLVQGGRFLMEPERFINFFNSDIFKIILYNALAPSENDHS